MVRLSATKAMWGHRGPMTVHSDKATSSNKCKTAGLPLNSQRPMDEVNGVAAWQMSVWMTKHGKALKPKLTSEHHRRLKQCFKLMDEDGSGAVSADELEIAFKLLAIKATRKEIEAMLVAAGTEDGDGEIGYDAYVQAMTAKLFTGLSRQKGSSQGKANTDGGLLSFDTQVNEYKRKKLIQALHEKDTQAVSMLKGTPRKTEVTAAVQLAASVAGDQDSSLRPVSASSAFVEDAVRERRAVFAAILPPVKKCNIYTPKSRPTSQQLLSSASTKHKHSSISHAPQAPPVSLAKTPISKKHCHKQSCGGIDLHHREGAHPNGISQADDHVGHHLAALQGLCSIEGPVQPVTVSSSKHVAAAHSKFPNAHSLHSRGGLAPGQRAQHTGPKHIGLPAVQIGVRKKQAVDMFGLGLNDDLQGKAVGLSIPGPVSSFW